MLKFNRTNQFAFTLIASVLVSPTAHSSSREIKKISSEPTLASQQSDCTRALTVTSKTYLDEIKRFGIERENVWLPKRNNNSPVYVLDFGFFTGDSKRFNGGDKQRVISLNVHPEGTIQWRLANQQVPRLQTTTDLLRIQSGQRHAELLRFHNGGQFGDQGYQIVAPPQNAVANRNQFAVGPSRRDLVASTNNDFSDFTAMYDYVRATIESCITDHTVIHNVVRDCLKDPQMVAEARAAYRILNPTPHAQEAFSVPISNTGINRYFKFKPTGSSELVSARILDIHREKDGYVLLIEWVGSSGDSGNRTRFVKSLSSYEELSSIPPAEHFSRYEVLQDFIDSLNLYELQTLKLAKKYGLQTFRYEEYIRFYNEESNSDPLTEMSRSHHYGINAFIERNFGSIDHLKRPEEMSPENFNVIDLFSRLDPHFVLMQFGDSGKGIKYIWVITEDGQLKIMPLSHENAETPRQLLRLAHGRHLFAGGTLQFTADGRLIIDIDGTGYFLNGFGSGIFDSSTNGDLKSFVAAAFQLQGKVPVSTVQGHTLDKLSVEFAKYQFDQRLSWDDLYANIPNWRTSTREHSSNNSSRYKDISWGVGQKDPLPLHLNEFLMETRRPGDESDKVAWAYYVLFSSKGHSFDQIKDRKRRLIQEINHMTSGEYGKDARLQAAIQAINDAFAVLKSIYNSGGGL